MKEEEAGTFSATLRVMGDLDPAEVTRMMGREPTFADRLGEPRWNHDRTLQYAPSQGMWSLESETLGCSGGDLEAQLRALLAALTDDLEVWRELGRQFQIDVFCGVFINDAPTNFAVSPELCAALGERGIQLDLDVYAPAEWSSYDYSAEEEGRG